MNSVCAKSDMIKCNTNLLNSKFKNSDECLNRNSIEIANTVHDTNEYDNEFVLEDNVTRVLKYYRPRGALARALYQKQISDEQLRMIDKRNWYKCNLSPLPEELADRFVQLNLDTDTNEFLKQSEEKSEWILTQLWHSIAKVFLGLFMTQTSINGLLGRGSMFVFSLTQFRQLLSLPDDWVGESCLDLGAGDGAVTARIAPIFKNVYVTEVSNQMRNILQKQNFKLLDVDNWHAAHKFDIITCLNLLDRCDRPLEILYKIRESLTPNGRAVIALVLPFSPYVETGSNNHRPSEKLNVYGRTFEKQVYTFYENVLKTIGFDLIKWSRVPYLCEGDINQSYYYLDDALFVIQKI